MIYITVGTADVLLLGIRRRMVRLVPNFRVLLVHHEGVSTFRKSNVATFHIEPRMTKLELREYLSKIYGLRMVGMISTSNLPKKGDSTKVFKKALVVLEK